jgi:membrane associated rhomboid family serine protease
MGYSEFLFLNYLYFLLRSVVFLPLRDQGDRHRSPVWITVIIGVLNVAVFGVLFLAPPTDDPEALEQVFQAITLLTWGSAVLSLILSLGGDKESGTRRSFPWATVTIVLMNVAVHLLVTIAQPSLEPYLLVPADLLRRDGLGALSIITASFLHADWTHLLGNMLLLLFFGRSLEDLLGPLKLGLFYLLCILASGILSVAPQVALPLTQGEVPSLGASGAVAGLLAGYLFLFSDRQVQTMTIVSVPFLARLLLDRALLYPILITVPLVIPIPAWALGVHFMATNILGAYLDQALQEAELGYLLVGVFAHIGGVIAGLAAIFLFLPAGLLHYRSGSESAS